MRRAKTTCWMAALGAVIGAAGILGAQTDEFPSNPFPRIETEMHSATIKRIAVDAGERFLVTASEDKTARVWDLPSGKLLQVIRPPEGDGRVGKLYAVAMTPDGATIALGGYTHTGSKMVYLFDRATGRLNREIDGLPGVVFHLCYSADGRFLAIGLGGVHGIRVYRTSDYQERARDAEYGADVYWIDFDQSGRLVSTSYDGWVRLYSAEFRLLRKAQTGGGKKPYSARFSPDGRQVAVGFEDSSAVNVLSGEDLGFLFAPSTRNVTGTVSTVAWSRDGQTLYAAGLYGQPLTQIVRWSGAGRGPGTFWPACPNTIMHLIALSGGRLAFGAAGPALGVLDRAGRIEWRHTQESLDLRSIVSMPSATRLLLSREGDRVSWTFVPGENELRRRRVLFSLPQRKLQFDPRDDASLHSPRTSGLNVAGWNHAEKPTLNGRALAIGDGETSRALAVSQDAGRFLLGADFSLRFFDRQGRQLWRADVPDAGWDVNLTEDGRYAVAALGDGTIRWYEAGTGAEVLALFVHKDGRRWVAWTPQGFYDASPGGESLFGYHLNQGADRAGEFVKVDQLRDLFYRQDLIARRLKPDGAEAIQAALKKVPDIRTVLNGGLPPDVALLSPAESQSQGEFNLQFRVEDRGGGIGRVVYRVDGAEIEGRAPGVILPGSNVQNHRFDLSPGRHEVTATVYNAKNQVESRSISAVVNVAPGRGVPSLYVVAAGISHYRDQALDVGVRRAADDAKAIVDRLADQGRGLFEHVTPYPLYNNQATRLGIEQAVDKVASAIKPADVFVLYLAGHGTAFDGKYYFVPWEVRYTSNAALQQQSLDQESLRKLLARIPAKKTLLLLDTCGSAAFAEEGRDPLSQKAAIDRLARITGRATLAAAVQTAFELDNHGVFTYAVLDALSKVADSDGLVQVSLLADYVEDVVPKLTSARLGQEQVPMWIFQGQTFPIARKR